MNWIVRADLPTPPPPTTTSLYSRRKAACMLGVRAKGKRGTRETGAAERAESGVLARLGYWRAAGEQKSGATRATGGEGQERGWWSGAEWSGCGTASWAVRVHATERRGGRARPMPMATRGRWECDRRVQERVGEGREGAARVECCWVDGGRRMPSAGVRAQRAGSGDTGAVPCLLRAPHAPSATKGPPR
jgi:hypothetical protein